MKKKVAKSVSIIDGSDGPTAVFLLGRRQRDRNIIQRIKSVYWKWIYKRKRDKAKREISPDTHSLYEVMQYVAQKYGAIEVDASYCQYHYDERRLQMLCSLVQREKPELISEDKPLSFLSNMDFKDEEQLRQWMHKVDDWTEHCMQKVKQLPEDAFSFTYHLMVINYDEDGVIEIELEDSHGIMGVSYSGDIKKCEPILKDIYLYYGVTQEDISDKTERYRSLLSCLSS